MKKRITRLVSIIAVLSVLCSVPAVAFADKPYSSSVNGGSGDSATIAKELLKSASNYGEIDLPKSSDYFVVAPASSGYCYVRNMYIDAPKGYGCFVHKSPALSSANIDTVYQGSRIYLIAEHDDAFCALYYTENYELKAGWINEDNLIDIYQCQTYQPPQASKSGTKDTYYTGDPIMSWSKTHFPGTKTDYSVLKMPIESCVEFTLDYQVISRNGAKTEEILGERDIYVNDGKNWIQVGSIDYDEYAACHIRVTLDSPITLYAVATIAHCKSTSFLFRQIIIDPICQS